jgi:sulfatase maturation enzyme AslB (radical SAM superfamily)
MSALVAATPRCMVCGGTHEALPESIRDRLWVYTNYDCNLRCTYCLVSSSPETPRRGLPLDIFQRLVDEAVALGCRDIFLTGGEPAILPHLAEMIAYATSRLRTTVLTNGMLWRGARLARLEAVRHPNLSLQISLDSGTPDLHDYYRGPGTWAKTVEGIRLLRERGFRVRTGSTETMHSRRRLRELAQFLDAEGILPEDQILRPLARRGESRHGAILEMADLVPELTVDVDGVYWHPVGPTDDLRISREISPLAAAFAEAERLWCAMGGQRRARVFT